MSPSKRMAYAWDTCVFLAWFNEEKDKPLDEIELILNDIESEKASLVVPVIVYAEILQTNTPKEKFDLVRGFLERPNIQPVSIDVVVADMAREVRELSEKEIGTGIKASDALVLACAMQAKATVLHTFDPKLLMMNGKPKITVPICKPTPIIPDGEMF